MARAARSRFRFAPAAAVLVGLVVVGYWQLRVADGPLISEMSSTGTCMVTPQAEPVTFGAAWVRMTGDQPVTFTSADLRDSRGLALVEASLLPPGVLPQGTGIGLPFPPTTYALDPVQTSIWNQRILPGHAVSPAADMYPVAVGLRLHEGVDHGTASGIVLNYSTGFINRHVEVPTQLLVVSKAVFSDCTRARASLGLENPLSATVP